MFKHYNAIEQVCYSEMLCDIARVSGEHSLEEHALLVVGVPSDYCLF